MTQKILIGINDAPYGSEKAYNALRLAIQPGKDHEEAEVRVFSMAELTNRVADSDKVITFWPDYGIRLIYNISIVLTFTKFSCCIYSVINN